MPRRKANVATDHSSTKKIRIATSSRNTFLPEATSVLTRDTRFSAAYPAEAMRSRPHLSTSAEHITRSRRRLSQSTTTAVTMRSRIPVPTTRAAARVRSAVAATATCEPALSPAASQLDALPSAAPKTGARLRAPHSSTPMAAAARTCAPQSSAAAAAATARTRAPQSSAAAATVRTRAPSSSATTAARTHTFPRAAAEQPSRASTSVAASVQLVDTSTETSSLNVDDDSDQNDDANNYEYFDNQENDDSIFSEIFLNSSETPRNENLQGTRIHNDNLTKFSDDIVLKFANALTQSFNALNNSNIMSNGNLTLVNRLTSAKSLPSFSGDPLDWVRFKQAFDLSTELGSYSEGENVTRLFKALSDDAREATKTLFAAGNNTVDIMKTLEMRFGNSRIILEKILKDIKDLPKMDLNEINLVEFATRLKNSVTVIKSLNHLGYLYSPELVHSILEKLSSSMRSNYIRYAALEDRDKPDLEKLANFLFKEAEMALQAGVVTPHTSKENRKSSERSSRTRSYQRSVFTTNMSENLTRKNCNSSCAHCGRRNHRIDKCNDFRKLSIGERWNIAKSANLCYKCLSASHTRRQCENELCKKCGRNHHELLHRDFKKETIQSNFKTENSSQAFANVKSQENSDRL